ncbi:hypothetical protein PQO03_18405 [Lentisphaera profundi]|uniref:Lipoprotein n=1 Tax=Lentisphaera profundi TaxID=1658616 RepID=A0ABY7VUQ6_9BACT|nr:hypothetical protein [Lentisphaera profundi]WDE97802.1 hypothetical protein PQO03_18405 [Lentisphaera profundi]
MSTKLHAFFFCLILLSLLSCKREQKSTTDYSETIQDYSELLNHLEQNKTEKLKSKLEQMNVEEKFHLQKLLKSHGEADILHQCNQLLQNKEFDQARILITEHTKQYGVSKSLADASRTLTALEKIHQLKAQLQTKDSLALTLKQVNQIENEMLLTFPKNSDLKTKKMKRWFYLQKKKLTQKANEQLARLRMISLLQIDQSNAILDFDSKSGAEIYYHQLTRNQQLNNKEKQLADSVITLKSNLKTAPASISDLILHLYWKASQQSPAETIIQLKHLQEASPLDDSLKNRIIQASLKAHNIKPEELEGPPLLNLPTLMHLILKSEQQD